MPGQIKPEQAEHYAEALQKGQPNRERISLTLFRDAVEGFLEDRETLEKAFRDKGPEVPGTLLRVGDELQVREDANQEPQATLDAQREGAPERP